MATTYKFNSGTETLTANIFADSVQIYDGHPLDPCTVYVWYHDPLNMDGTPTINESDVASLPTDNIVQEATRIGDGGNTFDVVLTDVSNSGEYFCVIQVGTTGDCWLTTERRRISIVECLDQADATIVGTGGSRTVRVRTAHYEQATFSNEGHPWITPASNAAVACDDPMAQEGVCLFAQTFSVESLTQNNNTARRAQPSITVGDLVCYFNTVQDYLPSFGEPLPDRPEAPFISLDQNGPSLINNPITVTATVGVIGGTLTDYTINWSTGDTGDSIQVDSPTARIETVSATVTDNDTGLTATASIDIVHIVPILQTSTVTGDIIQSLNTRAVWGQPPRTNESGIITVSGGGNWNFRATINPQGFFMGDTGVYRARLTITGPGVDINETLTTGATQTTQEELYMEFEGTTGTYNWTFAWDPTPNALPSNNITPTASVFFAARFF